MKLDKSFLTLFVGLAMAACSNDEEMATGGQDLLPVDGREAYMSVVVDMPKSTGTRAPGENHGTADEQNVNEVLLALFDASDVCLETKTSASTEYILNVGGNPAAGTGNAFKVPSTTAKVLAVVNPSDKFKAACVASASWSAINGAVEQTLDEVIGTSKNNFMMINAGDNANPANGALVTANVKVVDGTTITDVDAAIAAAEADRSMIYVDRVVAKVSLGTNPDGVKVPAGVTCTFGDWALNITNKSMFPYSEIVMPAGGSAGADYRIDPNYELAGFDVSQFNYLKVADDGTLPADFSAMADSKYCLENTTAADAQTQAQTTSAVASAVYTPNSFTVGESWFRLLGGTYKTLADLQAVYNAAKAAGTPDAAQQQIIDLCDQFYARIAVAATAQGKTVGGDFASITIAELDGLKSGGEYSKPDAVAGETVGVEYFQKGVCYYNILIRHDDAITATMAHGKYGVVRNNWYTLTINSVKQPGSPWLPDTTNPTDPKDPGEDDDDKEAYLSVEITVNPWTTWSQGVDL
ncbi:Mfa1 family fimbria major subunit [Bacteroides finegoldii]|jgi:putative lipoprotein|uniref:Mfa1 family fimbria major subunit n=1 Tax=Bacteroides finegoldii TaxID=338188 RepID=UPI002672F97B|nr:Mfa1 family fimbria major subunit [Bacteroides finegoldii]